MIPRHLLIGVAALLVLVVSMGIYLRRMRLQAVALERAGRQFPARRSSSLRTDRDRDSLRRRRCSRHASRAIGANPSSRGRQQRAEELLRALLRIYQQPGAAHPLSPAADIRSIFLVDPGAAVIDLNSAFADQHRSGILTEQLTVNSLVETLAINVPGIQRVKFWWMAKPATLSPATPI